MMEAVEPIEVLEAAHAEADPSPDPIYLEGGDTGILLLHGFTSTPYEFEPLSRFLHGNGYTVHAPLLAGHGTSVEEMEGTTYADWVQSAVDGYQKLQRRCGKIYVGGLSLGAAIALHIAANYHTDGVISMCSPIYTNRVLERVISLASRFFRFKRKTLIRPDYIQRYLIGYDRMPLRAIVSMMRLLEIVKTDLPRLQAPALILQSDRDETVRPSNGDYIYSRVSSSYKELKRYPRSGHILPVDIEKEQVFAEILSFLHTTS
jgi:carboxylesterase